MPQRAVIIGAGQIGAAIARRLADDGWTVTLVTRGERPLPAILAPSIDSAVADHADATALARAIGGGADALIDTIAYDAVDAERLIALEGAVGSIVAVSSVSVCADEAGRTLDEARAAGFPHMPVPMTEDQATVAPGPETYSTKKRAMELALLDRARVPVTIIRPCAVHGPESRDPREYWFVKRLLDGRRRIPIAYDAKSRFQTSATVNIAAVVAAALAQPATRILHAVDPDSPTIADIAAAIMAAIGRNAEIVALSGAPVGSVGATPWSIPLPFVFSDAAARAIGYVPMVDYAAGTVSACRWLVENVDPARWQEVLTGLAKYPYDLFDYDAEDRWLAAA